MRDLWTGKSSPYTIYDKVLPTHDEMRAEINKGVLEVGSWTVRESLLTHWVRLMLDGKKPRRARKRAAGEGET